MKTKVFNVIILDRSGSMESIRKAALEGFNETLQGIKKAQKDFSDTQEHFVSLITFCSCETKAVFDKTPVEQTHSLNYNDYEPCCCTPLYDAMGFTLTKMKNHVKTVDDAVVMVTVITDGLENDSKEYSGRAIKALVKELRENGWTFNYMGANQDAVEVAISMNIRNARNFTANDQGMRHTMARERNSKALFFTSLDKLKRTKAGKPIDRKEYTELADEAFDEEQATDL